MRIAILINNFQGGGGERVTVALANGLADLGHEVFLFVIKAEGPCAALVQANVSIVNLKIGRALFSLPPLIGRLRTVKPDVLLTSLVIANVLGALAGLFLRALPVVAVEHGDMAEAYRTERGNLAARVGYRLAPWVYRRLDRIFCVDPTTSASVATFTGRDNLPLVVMPNAVIDNKVDVLSRDDPDHPWLLEATPVFLAIGRMAEQKNFALLLEAFAEVVDQRPAKLIILGDGPLRSDLQAQSTSLGHDDVVSMPGFKSPYAYLRHATAFVLSSRWEALPTVVIEALYIGCPVVVTRASEGTLQLVDHGQLGLVAEEMTPSALAHEMLAVLESPKGGRDDRIAQGARYRVDTVALEYAREMTAVIAQRRSERTR